MAICVKCLGEFHPASMTIEGFCEACDVERVNEARASAASINDAYRRGICPRCLVRLEPEYKTHSVRGSVLPYPGMPLPSDFTYTYVASFLCPRCKQKVERHRVEG